MSITLAKQVPGYCIECSKPHEREPRSWRCWGCDKAVTDARVLAIKAVKKAIAAGQLPLAKSCVCVDCGGQARDYDHRDYLKPLDVAPVCRSCNQRRGPAASVTPRPITPSAEATTATAG